MEKIVKLLQITTVPETLSFLKGQTGYMKARGFEVHALSSPGEFLTEFAESEQVSVYAVKMHRRITPLQDIYAIFQVWLHLRQIRPQIVHAHTPKGGLVGTISAWLAGVPVRIYHIRGLPFMTATGYKRLLLRWSEKVSCLLANQVLCVSHSIREVAVAEICPADKVKVLLGGSGNGVDASGKFNPAQVGVHTRQEIRKKYGIPGEALVVGFVGRIVRDKGIAELVAAWKTLRAEFPNLHLLMVGSFEPQDAVSPDIENLLTSDERIHLTGIVYNTAPVYAAMDILTLPTYREGLPNVPLEAAAMELPVVATLIPGCIDAVQDGVTGTLVPPRNAEALADAIRMYLHDSELRRQHGQVGRDRVLRGFRQEAIWEAVYQEYLQLLQHQGLSAPSPGTDSTEAVLL
ncbi:MAG: glycosyltransferase family 4 protein [Gloeocapsa sp. UFS-A4-WI-NPMV-4B04]|jgi:glycosyltransferase involved in cell wall biosynthesis|nr:glycosyltransferase family 4 protein [Gloeocapsa sp. UFS-A4-WI-NPMV-4B04]